MKKCIKVLIIASVFMTVSLWGSCLIVKKVKDYYNNVNRFPKYLDDWYLDYFSTYLNDIDIWVDRDSLDACYAVLYDAKEPFINAVVDLCDIEDLQENIMIGYSKGLAEERVKQTVNQMKIIPYLNDIIRPVIVQSLPENTKFYISTQTLKGYPIDIIPDDKDFILEIINTTQYYDRIFVSVLIDKKTISEQMFDLAAFNEELCLSLMEILNNNDINIITQSALTQKFEQFKEIDFYRSLENDELFEEVSRTGSSKYK